MSGFGKADLDKFLPDTVDSRSRAKHANVAVEEEFKPRVDRSRKVRPHRRQQVPEWALEEGQDGTGGQSLVEAASASVGADRRRAPAIALRADGLAKARARGKAGRQAEQPAQRKKVEAEIIAASESESDSGPQAVESSSESEEEDDEVAARRARVRQRMAARREQEAGVEEEEDDDDDADERGQEGQGGAALGAASTGAAPAVHAPALVQQDRGAHGVEEESSSGEEESSSEEESSEDEDGAPRMKPLFVPRRGRQTILEQEKQEEEEERKAEEEKKQREERTRETRQLVAEGVAQEERDAAKGEEESEEELPDDEDKEEEQEEEYQKWKLREMQRLKRDKDAAEAFERERAETLRRRALTAEERAREDAELERQGLKVFKKEKEQMGFLQKYHHRGAFYMDDSSVRDPNDVRRRSAMEATGQDRFDKKVMPRVMQVKDFGLRSQTKWTHLSAEDTTSKDHPWHRDGHLREKEMRKRAGIKSDLDTAGRVVRKKR